MQVIFRGGVRTTSLLRLARWSGGEQNGWMDATGWFLVPVHHDTILVEEVVYFWDCGM